MADKIRFSIELEPDVCAWLDRRIKQNKRSRKADVEYLIEEAWRKDALENGKIVAPFSSEQVEALNKYQANDLVHEYTCGAEDRSQCPSGGTLIATPDGWVCPCGKYTQRWAWNPLRDRVNQSQGEK